MRARPLVSGTALASGLLLSLAICQPVRAADSLDFPSFQNPPASARPHTWWHWMDGNITKKGITLDLESMQRVGIGGVQIFDVDYNIPDGPIRYFTPEWREMLKFAESEAKRLGLEIGLANCAGWSSTGGPWIKPSEAMQAVVVTEERVHGPAHIHQALPSPKLKQYADFYHDVATLAFKTPTADSVRLRDTQFTLTASGPGESSETFQHNPRSLITIPGATAAAPQWALFEFKTPFGARSASFDMNVGRSQTKCEVQKSDDGITFTPLTTADFHGHGQVSLSFPGASARFYRLYFTCNADEAAPITLSDFDLLGGYRLPEWPGKSGFAALAKFGPAWATPAPDGTVYQQKDMTDLSGKVIDGQIDWNVPEGEWTVFRIGYAPNGRENHPAVPEGRGLEVDKMSKAALDTHFSNLVDKLLADAGSAKGSTLTTLLIDSYEGGDQNWTPAFRDEFRKRRGYDLLPYLPAFTGRVVDSTDITERFLWDVRRTVADLFLENYYTHFVDLCHQRGMKAAVEPYDGPFETITGASLPDMPMSEFWNGSGDAAESIRTRLVASGAHLNDHAVVGAESFTGAFNADQYTQTPFSMKARGDFEFTEGINRFIFHTFVHQPWADLQPGMTMGPWGTHFGRTNPWWEQSREWMTYIARSQLLLQSGRPFADLLCFAGEDARAHSIWGKNDAPQIPPGYDFEFASADVLLGCTVNQGEIVTPNHLHFKALMLPHQDYMLPAIATKLLELSRNGATIVGAPPTRSPSLTDYPACDEAVRNAAAIVWNANAHHTFANDNIDAAINSIHLVPDFSYDRPSRDRRLVFKHRRFGDADVYFVSNQEGEPLDAACTFRVAGKTPELWDAATGRRENAAEYLDNARRETLPLHFDPAGSIFVVFREPSMAHLVSVQSTGGATKPRISQVSDHTWHVLFASAASVDARTETGQTLHAATENVPAPLTVKGPWQVTFPAPSDKQTSPLVTTFDTLTSWSQSKDDNVRYFAGTAVYRTTLTLPAGTVAPGHRLSLDLGTVKDLAQITVNETLLDVLWKPPYAADVASAVHDGANSVSIAITNVLANRLIGDERFPDDTQWSPQLGRGMSIQAWPDWLVRGEPRPGPRLTFSTWKFYNKASPLLDAGLLGPVTLRFSVDVPLK